MKGSGRGASGGEEAAWRDLIANYEAKPEADDGPMPELRVQGFDGPLGPELVGEAQTDAERHDRADDHRVRPFPDEERHDRRRQQEQEERAPQLASEDGESLRVVRAKGVESTLTFGVLRLPVCRRLIRQSPSTTAEASHRKSADTRSDRFQDHGYGPAMKAGGRPRNRPRDLASRW